MSDDLEPTLDSPTFTSEATRRLRERGFVRENMPGGRASPPSPPVPPAVSLEAQRKAVAFAADCATDDYGYKSDLSAAAATLRDVQAREKERAELIAELENIARADWRKWDEPLNTPEDFVAWAQSRASFLLSRLSERAAHETP